MERVSFWSKSEPEPEKAWWLKEKSKKQAKQLTISNKVHQPFVEKKMKRKITKKLTLTDEEVLTILQFSLLKIPENACIEIKTRDSKEGPRGAVILTWTIEEEWQLNYVHIIRKSSRIYPGRTGRIF